MGSDGFRLLTEQSPDMVCRVGPNGTLSYVSPGSVGLVGWTPEELNGRSAYEFIHPDDAPGVRRIHENLLDEDEVGMATHRFRTSSGEYLWVETTARRIQGADGADADLHTASRDASDRVAAEQGLRRSEALHRTLSANIPDVRVMLLDRDLSVLLVEGRPTQEVPPFTPDKLLGLTLEEARGVVPADLLEEAEPYLRAALGGEHGGYVTSANGGRYAVSIAPVHDDAEVTGVLVVARDVTEQSEAEERARMRAELLDAVDAAVIATDLEGDIRSWNKGAEKLYGYTEAEVLGRSLPKLFDDLQVSESWSEAQSILHAGEASEGLRELRAKDGSPVVVFARAVMYKSDTGDPAGLIGVSVDARARAEADRERHEAQAQLAQRARQHEVLASLGRLALKETDLDAFMQRVVAMVVESLDADAGGILELLPERETARVVADIGLRSSPGEAVEMASTPGTRIHHVIEQRGAVVIDDLCCDERFPAEQPLLNAGVVSSMTVVVEGRDRPYGIIGAHSRSPRHFTEDEANFLEAVGAVLAAAVERRQAELVNESLQQRLARSERLQSLGRLTGGIAHDFNNMLSLISGYGELAEDQLAGHPAASDIRAIRAAAARATALTKQLLVFAQAQPTVVEVVEVNELLGRLAPMLRRTLGGDVDLALSLGADFARVEADATKLEQVIVNLIVNARDAMPSGGSITIETETLDIDWRIPGENGVAPGRYTRIRVRDTGVGMPPQVQARAFDPFFTTKPKGQGTGLGLATSYGAITQLGGTMEIASAPGAGSTFDVLLPTTTAAATDAAAKDSLPPEAHTGSRVLIAEDEPEVLELTSRILRSYGYEVTESASATEAATLAEAHDFDLLLTDVVMPELNGIDLAERLRARVPGLPVVFMSGHNDRGADLPEHASYLQKPFTRTELLRCVSKTLTTPPAQFEGRRP